jgi:HEAT repeat protein
MLCTMQLSRLMSMTALLALPSCAPDAGHEGFDAEYPVVRMRAIEQAAKRGDTTAVPRLVEQLDSDDPAVRSLAISALRRLTGVDHG